ncbi:PH domain-containing protein [Microbacterium betulae]|uniref:PH domain-containing protein n=1 Tax=Microbacterium betulae TaxID=2981139 RepID=A0AA97I7M4_9MICO|nr:PH domain-containing protein [Microbacterium sp. AB]WOF24432.1 PH domain-containing protein [Microbacterium sp. AB]
MSRPDATSRTIRGNAGIVWLVLTAAVVLFLLGDVVVRGGAYQALLIAPWLLLPVWFVWVFLYAPHVTADRQGVRVRNPLRTTEIPWDAVREITLRWQVAFRLADGREIQAWAVAAKRPNRRSHDQPAERETEILRELRENALPSVGGEARQSWDVPALASLLALLAWAAAAVALAG